MILLNQPKLFLAHLSTKCSERDIVIGLCPLFIVNCMSSIASLLPCVCSRGHIFSPIIIRLSQNVCLDKILDDFENGSCQVKSRSLDQILGKLCVHSRGHIFSTIFMKLGDNVSLDEISDRSCLVKK